MAFHDNGALAAWASRVSPSPARMSSTIKFGVGGYGYWGPNIVRNLQGIENVEIAAVCDKSSTARRRAHKNHTQLYVMTDASEAITSPEIAGVALVTLVWM